LIVGLAYKANVDDMRESPAFALLDFLHQRGAELAYYDPHIPVISKTREHMAWSGTRSLEWNEQTITGFDIAVVVTAHSLVNYQELVDWVPCIVDSRNALANYSTHKGQVWKA
jgi:UDP-N-acetyl-D-glucosamine dehydrogenase